MTKNELIEAINATIVPNGQKAITAESLANLLMEMVNATPEGENGGNGQVVFYMGMPNFETGEFYLTQEQMTHNAKMVKVIKESPIAIQASVDVTEYIRMELAETGADLTEVRANMISSPTIYYSQQVVDSGVIPIGTDGVALQCMFALFVKSDGSVVLLDI